jgi:hypothetical protein
MESHWPLECETLRYTFAVHRLTAWYKHGANLNRMIPALAAIYGLYQSEFRCSLLTIHSRALPHSSLDYRTPEEFRKAVYVNVESKQRFPHLHRLDGGCEIISELKQNWETPVISG